MDIFRRGRDSLRAARGTLAVENDHELVWRTIEKVFAELRTPYEPDSRLWRLSPGLRGVYALDWVRKEVGNGGFDQYMTNSTGYLTPEAIEGAELIGAPEYAEILRRASGLLPSPFPRDRDERTDLINAQPEESEALFEELDNEFMTLLEGERDLTGIMASYIRSHPDEFFA